MVAEDPALRRFAAGVVAGIGWERCGLPYDDYRRALDSGLFRDGPGQGQSLPANPIYQETLLEALAGAAAAAFPAGLAGRWAQDDDVDLDGLLREFQKFCSNNLDELIKNNILDVKADELFGNNQNSAHKNVFDSNYKENIIDKNRYNMLFNMNKAFAFSLLYIFLKSVLDNNDSCIELQCNLTDEIIDIYNKKMKTHYYITILFNKEVENIAVIKFLVEYITKRKINIGYLVVFDTDSKESRSGQPPWETETKGKKTIHVIRC
jgi:hypothetical protein